MKNNLQQNFQQWLVGFTDGDGAFFIKKIGNSFIFCLAYHLHKLDKLCLDNIQKGLDLDKKVDIRLKSVQLLYLDRKWLVNTIVPIFEKFPLLTHKYYSYSKWKEALIINLKGLPIKELIHYKELINNYVEIKNIKIPYNKINDYWILGFIEAEGSFTIPKTLLRNISAIYISQNTLSTKTIELIVNYILLNWKPIDSTPLLIKKYLLDHWDNIIHLNYNKKPKPIKYMKGDGVLHYKEVINLTILNIDFLYYVIIPKLDSLTWFTKKEREYREWRQVVKFFIIGLHRENKNVQDFINYVKLVSNRNRYRNNLTGVEVIDSLLIFNISLLDSLNKLEPIYNLDQTYKINSLDYIQKKRGSGVYIYNLNKELVILFKSQNEIAKEFKTTDLTIRKYIKNKLIYKNKYYLTNLKIN